MGKHANNPSRYLTLVLRHKPELAGLTADERGWVRVDGLLGHLRGKYGGFSRAELEELVAENPKQRFEMAGNKIRAVQGHSFAVDLSLEAVTPPEILYHGTKMASLQSIFKLGLLPRGRTHVHLSYDVPTASTVGRRRPGAACVLAVATAGAGPFYRARNGVWLVDAVPPTLLSVHKYLE